MTKEQLKHAAEVMLAAAEGKRIECYCKHICGSKEWNSADLPVWNWEDFDYRIAPNQPTPKERVPLAKGDFIGIWWIKRGKDSDVHRLVSAKTDYGIMVCAVVIISYKELMDDGWLRSQDEVNWLPCWKEI